MNDQEIKAGAVVRVKDPNVFISGFGKRVANRDALVNWVGPNKYGHFEGRAIVTFQKRNGRGKEFREVMNVRDLYVVAQGVQEC